MCKSLKNSVKNTLFGNFAFSEYHRITGKWRYEHIPEYDFIVKQYFQRFHRFPDLVSPKRFSEKLIWEKIFWRDELARTCSDKYTVREYVKSIGRSELLNDLIAVYASVDEFSPEKLPNQFVIKASHGSGWNLIVKDKSEVSWFWWKKIMRSWMRQNLAWFGHEWNYDHTNWVPPRLVVEKYLEDETGELRDFKVFCFGGVPKFVMVEEDRYADHKRIFLDTEAMPLGMSDRFGFNPKIVYERKETWDQVIAMARELSKPFAHVRCDFYVCKGKVFFGEMTFFNDSGYASFNPDEFDFSFGDMLILPEPNYNLDLLEKIRARNPLN